jgi:hypothetical protein
MLRLVRYYFHNLGPRWCGRSEPRPGRFSYEKDPVPIVQEAGWAPGPVWTGAENLAHTGIRSPDRPARTQSLYRLSYRDPPYLKIFRKVTESDYQLGHVGLSVITHKVRTVLHAVAVSVCVMKAYNTHRGMAPPTLKLGASCSWVLRVTPWPLCHPSYRSEFFKARIIFNQSGIETRYIQIRVSSLLNLLIQ